MPQQCNTLGKLEDPLVPQMHKQHLDGKRNKTNHKTPVLHTTKFHSSFEIHPPATSYFFMLEMYSSFPKVTITTLDILNDF